MKMKKVLVAFTIILTCVAADQRADFLSSNWKDLLQEMEADSLLPHQEQAPARLRCHVCLEPLSLDQCTAQQTLRLCETGFSCYTLHAFETTLNTYIFAKGCFPAFICNGNQGCEFLNRSRNGTIDSCSFQCCHTDQCNEGPSVSSTTPPSIPSTAPPTVPSISPPTVPSTPPPPAPSPITRTSPPPTVTTQRPMTPITVPTSRPGQCGSALSSPSGTFASPNYPGNYPNNAHCVWTITVPQGSKLKIELAYFLTERRYDYLKVYVGRRTVRHLTGKVGYKSKITSIQGTGELISIVFRSDRSVTRKGFFAKYSVQRALSCGGALTGSSGNFKSPGYPGNYPNNVHCKWTVALPRKASLVLAFRAFETERCYDYVKVFRGRRLVRRLSGRYVRYGRYRGGGDDKRSVSQEDDDCDGDDDDDDDDDDDEYENDDYHDDTINSNSDSKWNNDGYHSDFDNFKRTYRRYTYARRIRSRHGSRTRNRYRSPYVTRVSVRGTGEQITIIFKSNRRNTRKGFDAMYRVSQGYYGR